MAGGVVRRADVHADGGPLLEDLLTGDERTPVRGEVEIERLTPDGVEQDRARVAQRDRLAFQIQRRGVDARFGGQRIHGARGERERGHAVALRVQRPDAQDERAGEVERVSAGLPEQEIGGAAGAADVEVQVDERIRVRRRDRRIGEGKCRRGERSQRERERRRESKCLH